MSGGHGVGDLAAHQDRRYAGADLHHRQRHDEGRDADAGDAEGGEEPEQRTAGEQRKNDGDRSRASDVADVHVVGLQREEGQARSVALAMAPDREIDLGG